MRTPAKAQPSVRWDEPTGAFRVTGFDAASVVLRGRGWSSDLRRSPLVSEELKEFPFGNPVVSDPPDHTRLRRLISPAFTPAAISSLQPRISAVVDAVLLGLPEIGPTIDVVADVGYPISLAVICELLDVGTEGAQVIAEQTPELVRAAELDATLDELTASAVANLELMLFLTPILARRREHPVQDFISALLAIPDLELHEVLATCILLLVAGHETTANLIANSTLAMLRNPDQVRHLSADPPRAVEELLRSHGPVKAVVRTALIDHDLGGVHIPAGQAVLIDLRAANLDPHRFAGAERMDLARAPVGHLAFGGGIHFCLGTALARLEAVEALPKLLALQLIGSDGASRWRQSTFFHALDRLVVSIGTGPHHD